MKSGDQVIQRKGGETKKSMPETKRVAQNTYSIKFSALQTPRKIQNSFLKRALEWRDFQEPETNMKQMYCYQNNLTIKPLSNYYVFSKIFKYLMFGFYLIS